MPGGGDLTGQAQLAAVLGVLDLGEKLLRREDDVVAVDELDPQRHGGGEETARHGHGVLLADTEVDDDPASLQWDEGAQEALPRGLPIGGPAEGLTGSPTEGLVRGSGGGPAGDNEDRVPVP